MLKSFTAALALGLLVAGAASAQDKKPAKPAAAATSADDRYVGYYYPKPNAIENYESTLKTIDGVDRAQRVQFVTVISQGTLQSAYRVPYAVFVKGEKADKLFQERTVAEDSTFFDLLKLLGFASVTITDGDKAAHQVTIK
jgi:hypothetical protein